MTARPLVFSNCDGVINKIATHRIGAVTQGKPPYIADSQLVENLRNLCLRTNAQIVISSTWRKYVTRDQFVSWMGDWLEAHLPRGEAWRTNERSITGYRGDDIDEWLANHTDPLAPVAPYICIDDDGDFYSHQGLVQTTMLRGLTKAKAEEAIATLRARGWSESGNLDLRELEYES